MSSATRTTDLYMTEESLSPIMVDISTQNVDNAYPFGMPTMKLSPSMFKTPEKRKREYILFGDDDSTTELDDDADAPRSVLVAPPKLRRQTARSLFTPEPSDRVTFNETTTIIPASPPAAAAASEQPATPICPPAPTRMYTFAKLESTAHCIKSREMYRQHVKLLQDRLNGSEREAIALHEQLRVVREERDRLYTDHQEALRDAEQYQEERDTALDNLAETEFVRDKVTRQWIEDRSLASSIRRTLEETRTVRDEIVTELEKERESHTETSSMLRRATRGLRKLRRAFQQKTDDYNAMALRCEQLSQRMQAQQERYGEWC